MSNIVKLFPADTEREIAAKIAAAVEEAEQELSLVDRIRRAKLVKLEAIRATTAADPVPEISETATSETAPEYSVTTRPGYMGAVAWDGNNSHRSDLYGAGLSRAIREALKGDGIKGVTVAVSTYSGGQSIKLTIKATPADYIELGQYILGTTIFDFASFDWIDDTDEGRRVSKYDVNDWSPEKVDRVHTELARRDYERMTTGSVSLNHYHIDDYKAFTPSFTKKLHRIAQIVNSFNYDDSNSQVDYFNRGFYEDWFVKNAAK